MNNKTLVNN